MSLGRLLTTGKSLVGLHSSSSRYQLRKGALPKFESSKNPFAAKAQPGTEDEPSLIKLTPAEMAAASLKETQRLPLLVPKPTVLPPAPKPIEPVRPAQPAAPETVPAAVESWLKKINPLVWWGNRKSAESTPAVARFNKRPVQAEFSLDNIKVMRNDLSDADVEVVTAKSRPPAASMIAADAPAAAMAIPELPPARNAWEYLGERLLGKH
jgi:hypothetical protein